MHFPDAYARSFVAHRCHGVREVHDHEWRWV